MNLFKILIGTVAIAGMFLLLVGPHEFGHFMLAKFFRVGVYEFSLGMGNRIWSTVRGGTLYALRAIPLGGYVRLAGMEPGDYEAPSGFHSKRALQRLLILAGGPVINFVVATLIMTGVYLTQLNQDPGKVVGVLSDGPAYAQGVRPGDSIVSVDGRRLKAPEDVRKAEDAKPGQPLTFTLRRANGTTFNATITPTYNEQDKHYLVGVQTARIVTLKDALAGGISFPVVATVVIAQTMYQVATGQIPGGLFGQEGATGPIGFGYLTYHAAAEGLVAWLALAALLSMALGLTNLLPIPALDGGRMLVVILEKVRGRPFDRARVEAVQRAGLIALLAFMALIAFFDVQRIATGQFPGG